MDDDDTGRWIVTLIVIAIVAAMGWARICRCNNPATYADSCEIDGLTGSRYPP